MTTGNGKMKEAILQLHWGAWTRSNTLHGERVPREFPTKLPLRSGPSGCVQPRALAPTLPLPPASPQLYCFVLLFFLIVAAIPFHLPRHHVRRILGVFSSHFIFGTPETSLQLRISAEYSICCGLGLAKIAQFARSDVSFGVMHFSAGNPCHWEHVRGIRVSSKSKFPGFYCWCGKPLLGGFHVGLHHLALGSVSKSFSKTCKTILEDLAVNFAIRDRNIYSTYKMSPGQQLWAVVNVGGGIPFCIFVLDIFYC